MLLQVKTGRLADASSILASIGASACCLGPVVLVALGFGTAAGAVSAFFAPLAPLRPYLLVVSFGIVGWRLVSLYRGERACEAQEGHPCPAEGRWREKALTWGVLGVVALFAVSPYLLAALPASVTNNSQSSNATNPAVSDVCLVIDGMTCSSCARHVETELAGVPGVVSAAVHFDRGEACLTVDKARTPTMAQLLSVIEAAGYRAKPKAIGT